MEDDKHQYFGGGSVDVVCPSLAFKVSRRQPSLLASLKNGTVHYRGIISLINGFNELHNLGGMEAINQHSMSIAAECVNRLRKLRHRNGRPAVVIYGAWGKDTGKDKGPTVSFNCLRSDGSYVGYNEVSKLAELHDPPLQLRTGCFCNPGACQEALGLSDEDVKNNYLINGHVCGDHIDIVKGRPTGAIRASFGKDNLWEDMDYLISFVEESFVDSHDSRPSGVAKPSAGVVEAGLMEMYIYPIKSCAAQRVKSWSLESETGRLAFDREFALVDSSGSAMRLQRYPQMSQIQPRIDLESMTMRVSAPGFDDLIMKLGDGEPCVKSKGPVQVCGNSCGGQLWGDYESSQWFSRYLGVQCWLARHIKDSATNPNRRQSHPAFANEEPILLICRNAVDELNLVLEKQGQSRVQTKHFRPNFVVSVDDAYVCTESKWTVIKHDRTELCFQNVGDCARCSMVDVDPTTGLKGKTLRALSEHNRRNGRITFGIFLRAKDETIGYDGDLSEGDILFCR
ncbi:MOSC N-terminal beta barrel domain [Fragilaria crotonensis]|nr:MOSC N-terminal beta barrel domain [Fragilaria crotonensis]